MMLTQVMTLALEIQHIIETSGGLWKLKKRISQQANCKSNMVKQIVKPETVLQCYNSDLNWENAYPGLENILFFVEKSPWGESDTAAQIKSCFIYQVQWVSKV